MDIFSQIVEVKKKFNYTLNVLSKGGLEEWEAKEYSALIDCYRLEIQDLQTQIDAYEGTYA